MYKNWTQFRNAVQNILSEENIPAKFNDIGIIIFIHNLITSESKDMNVLFNFPLIFSPTTLRVHEKMKFRPSKLEVQDSFMAYVAVSLRL